MSATSFDDELATGQPSTPKPATTVVNNDSLFYDFCDQDAMSTGDGLDRIEPADKKSKVRFALLTNIVRAAGGWIHFIKKGDKVSVYRCLTERDKKHVPTHGLADCCKKLNSDDNQKAQAVFAVLALKYRNCDPSTGKYPVPAEGEAPTPIVWELGWVKLSRPGYKQVSELVQEGEKEYMFDIAMAFRENKIGYNYTRVSKAARWTLDEGLKNAVLAEAEKYKDGQVLINRLGKVVTPLDMKAILAGQNATNAVNSKEIDNTNDL